jgi:hypothetical protein
METKKLSLSGIKNVLSRAELKKIMAGSGGVGSAYCIGSTGSWYYPSGPVSYSQCSQDITTYCSSGHGGCNAA